MGTYSYIAVLGAGTTLGFYAGYTVFDNHISKKSVQDAIHLSGQPGSPSAERIIEMQIKVRESFHLSNILRPYLEALSKSSSSVSISKLEAEVRKLEAENAVLLERLRNTRLAQEQKGETVLFKQQQTNSKNDTHSEASTSECESSLFPFSKKNFNPVVWEILKRVHGEEFLEHLEDRPTSSQNQDAAETKQSDTK